MTAWKQGVSHLRESLSDPEVRLRLRAHIAQFIERIDIYSLGHAYLDADSPTRRSRKRSKKLARKLSRKHSKTQVEVLDERERLRKQEREWREDTQQYGEHLADDIREFCMEANVPKGHVLRSKAFHDYVTARRMSKDGRFVRVHFTSGARVDLVPAGSIASGRVWQREKRGKFDWLNVGPSIDSLLDSFTAKPSVSAPKRQKRLRGVKPSTT